MEKGRKRDRERESIVRIYRDTFQTKAASCKRSNRDESIGTLESIRAVHADDGSVIVAIQIVHVSGAAHEHLYVYALSHVHARSI